MTTVVKTVHKTRYPKSQKIFYFKPDKGHEDKKEDMPTFFAGNLTILNQLDCYSIKRSVRHVRSRSKGSLALLIFLQSQRLSKMEELANLHS